MPDNRAMTAHETLVSALNDKRSQLSISHKAFAELLDMPQADWANVRHGKRLLTLGQVSLIKQTWPDLTTPAIDYLFERGQVQRDRKIARRQRAA